MRRGQASWDSLASGGDGSGGTLSLCINTGWEGLKKTETDFSQWAPTDRVRSTGNNQNYRKFHSNIKPPTFLFVGQTLEEVAQRGGGISILGELKARVDKALSKLL